MDCDICREALSARSDGEAEPVPAEVTDAHLESCAACRQWQLDSAVLTRGLRLRPAVDVPDLTDRILAAAPPPPTARTTRGWYPRAALAGVAVAQLTLGLAQVFGVNNADTHAGHGSAHLFNESTAWNLALGLGMLWTALRPRASTGLLPVMAGFVAVLTPFSAHDLIAGTAPLSRITSHAFLVLGLVVLLVVHRTGRTPEDGARTTGTDGTPLPVDDDTTTTRPRPDTSGTRWRHLRPVSGKHAA
ncbi:zf-HC2 domain-containing protein [Umezawaea endophytica]|uniref:Zf-HC2 domain-containing protein n=1 Tax=Umezawaea endophytica TaxID=1654476 RepID=A0A9X2VF08_9PSEU|nr:zf-HC2 domain-containing protein [Umezawaea endophytica]MCS7475431.1 zf-HC2 domain-containing protein [Umezawaea endophytica]